MTSKNRISILMWLLLLIGGGFFAAGITSCGKQSISSPTGLNIRYQVLNLSPDLFPVNLYIKFILTNPSPYVFESNQGYFFVPYTDTPYQFRTALISGSNLFSRDDVLKSGATYSLYITGDVANNSIKQIFTVDTASLPAVGRGKIRFVNASPTGVGGLDITANGTPAFSKIIYPNFTDYIEVPVGNYDFQINATGSPAVLKDLPNVTIQDGRLYTIYAYGYTSRIDTAAFNATYIQNN